MTGGVLIRSIGGWKELKELRKANIRLQSDERILGDSEFVDIVLKNAEEKLDRRQHYKTKDYDFDREIEQVAEIFALELRSIFVAVKH